MDEFKNWIGPLLGLLGLGSGIFVNRQRVGSLEKSLDEEKKARGDLDVRVRNLELADVAIGKDIEALDKLVTRFERVVEKTEMWPKE